MQEVLRSACMLQPKPLDGAYDLSLLILSSTLLKHPLLWIRNGVGPVEFDDAQCQFRSGQYRRGHPGGRSLLDAQVENRGEQGVFVRGRLLPQLEDGQDLLGKRERGAVGVHDSFLQ